MTALPTYPLSEPLSVPQVPRSPVHVTEPVLRHSGLSVGDISGEGRLVCRRGVGLRLVCFSPWVLLVHPLA